MYQVCFYVPETHLEQVKTALFQQGAGKVGNYSCCSWQVKGEGQFNPLSGSQPFIGKVDTIEHVVEYKVEMVCDDKFITSVIAALRQSHPYEEPAFQVIKLEDF